jgi:hypothetical protein
VFTSKWADNDSAPNTGIIYIYYGAASTLDGGNVTDADSSIQGTSYHNYIGNAGSVSFGNLNGDKFSDIVLKSFIHSDTDHYGGEIYIQFGQRAQLSDTLTSELLKYYRFEHVDDGIDRMNDMTVADINNSGKDDIIIVNTQIGQVQVIYR